MIDPTTLKDLASGALVVLALAVVYMTARIMTPVLSATIITLKEALEGQRQFYQQRMEELAKEHHKEIDELRASIKGLESENRALRAENARLKKDLETLRKRFNHEGGRKPR